MGGPRAGRAGAGVSAAQLPAHRDVEATYNDINGFIFYRGIEEIDKKVLRVGLYLVLSENRKHTFLKLK